MAEPRRISGREARNGRAFERVGSTRSAGLAAAIVVGLALAGGFGWLILKGANPIAKPRAAQEIPPDIMGLTAGGPGGSGVGRGLRVELADRQDPTRRSALITSETIEPLEARRYAAGEPAAWVFLRDGRTLWVRADRGRFAMPARDQAPERGEFEGNVLARVFASGMPEAPATAPALTEIRAQRLEFDLTLPSLTIPGRLSVVSGAMSFEGEDARAVFDQVREKVELLRIERTLVLTFDPANEAKAPREPDRPAAAGVQTPATPGPEVIYQITLGGPVRASRGGIEATGLGLEGVLRTFGNRLRPGAIAPFPRLSAATPPEPGVTTPPAGVEPPAGERPGDVLTIACEGPLEVRPIDDAGPRLARNDVFVRLMGRDDRPATVRDAGLDAGLSAPVIEYAATTLDASASGTLADSVRVRTAREGELVGRSTTVNLASRVAQIRGAGRLTTASRGEDGGPVQHIAFTDQADFVFSRSPRARGWQIEDALFAGAVDASDGPSTLAGALVQAKFELDGRGRSRLARLGVTGGGRGADGRGGRFAADRIDARFEPDLSGKARPVAVSARGDVRASREGESLEAESLDLTLAPVPGATEALRVVIARGGDEPVVYTGKDEVVARTPELRADAHTRRVDLSGPGTRLSRGPATINAEVVRLSDSPRGVEVVGPGTFEQAPREGDDASVARAVASWTEFMRYDDATGVLEATGLASAEVRTGPLEVEKIDAHAVRVEFGAAAGPGQSRPLARALAQGLEGDRPAPARVEYRRYAPGQDQALERLYYIEGQEISADNHAGTVNVPGAGKFLVVDRRGPSGDADAPGATPRGTALLSWRGSMDFARDPGRFDALGGASLTHQRLADGSVVLIEGERLGALIRGLGAPADGAEVGAGGEGGGGGGDPELINAEAVGAVFVRVRSGPRERQLVADEMVYDARTGVVRARAAEGREVTLFDTQTATPMKSRAILWDLARDRVEVISPEPLVVPR
ncbi:MAG: hypothetical protein HRU70_13860 [Phycisphaeraceae bacterium]|nr:MAG: hypothetical protein HRU70_13860 [Phycisphaeraceae bacterium]